MFGALLEAAPHERLEAAFGRAAPAHFAWQTVTPMVADRERELVESAFLPLGERILDVGCGEGATLWHLGEPEGAVGVDLFEDKIRFARTHVPRCHFVTAAAEILPFEDHSFDHVLVRDVIHHLPRPSQLIAEVHRVLAPGGRLDVLEPCRYNPLILLHALLNPAERGELRSTPEFLFRLLAEKLCVEPARHLQAFPLHRVLFHPDLGVPALAERASVRRAVALFERIADVVVPDAAHAYLHLRGYRE